MTPQLNSEHREIFVEADRADSLKQFLTQAGITITSDCRDVEAVLGLARGADLERVWQLLLQWSAEEHRAHRGSDVHRRAEPSRL